jgi:hypothetical protein
MRRWSDGAIISLLPCISEHEWIIKSDPTPSSIQNFYAHLALTICIFKPPPGKFVNEQSENLTAYSVAALVLKMYIQESVDLVAEAVKKRINEKAKGAGQDAKQEAMRLKNDLIKWKALVDPLAYTPGGQSGNRTLDLVIRLVVANVEDMQFGLNLAKPKSSMTYQEFGYRLYAMGRRLNPEAIGAPLRPKGPTASLLPLAVKKLATIGNCTAATESTYMTDIFAHCASVLRIHFIPWHSSPRTGERRTLLPRHDHWVIMDKAPGTMFKNQATAIMKANPTSASQQGSQYMAANNSNTPWNADGPLSEMPNLKKKNNLPYDWSLEKASINKAKKRNGQLIQQTYQWFQDNYDGRQWKHKLAIVIAILFSRIIPFVYIDPEEKGEVKDAMRTTENVEELTSLTRKLSWVDTHRPCGSKGSSTRKPFVTMVLTYVLAMMDERSPVRVDIQAKKGTVESSWSQKHSEC